MAKSMESEFRARIARIAKRQVGQTACSRETDGKPGFFTSCHGGATEPELWCSDFARWVWWKAGAINAAPGTRTPLNAAAGRFVLYGKLRRRPRVGDAVLFNYNKDIDNPVANHVAIVVQVNANGTIRSVSGDIGGHGKSDADFAKTSSVVHDKPYPSAIGSFGPNAPNGPVSGYISPVEDDMPYTKKQIIGFVKEGVSEELNTKLKNSNVTPARGAQAAVDTQKALKDLQTQVTDLIKYVKANLPPASPAVPASSSGAAPASTSGTGPASPSGTGPASTSGAGPASNGGAGPAAGGGTRTASGSGTGGRRTGTKTRTSPTT